MDEREILRIAVRHDIDQYLTEALTLEFVRDVLKAARRTTPDREAWISVDEKLPACDRKAGTMGVEVLIYPAMETGERTAFFGRRISQKPMFYRYGAPVHGVTHWMPLPAAPTSDQGEKS
ncbi:DUF551 domain-containing protein [Burkholderia multivorans]|uniref:DUF551 domain-containing protein n=1 Tax=Burkholderia multivorans TaxID=87883 RepID=UPI00285FCAB0|nr:DUF551 domain-containing protein [Burkholderia multivorans]MDR8915842.1 hypothetical protein [Burkholderia multivorans]MDR8926420.1 hypothetical protein [Burkholderia multivorans]MDR8964005.1 hypothetical protein [Burkholderia multivorans]MDR8992376.1 hypothetical protein [Burkholderia multivorans]MDR9019213.1 hypothetical protein [Burkholderia multivorans]